MDCKICSLCIWGCLLSHPCFCESTIYVFNGNAEWCPYHRYWKSWIELSMIVVSTLFSVFLFLFFSFLPPPPIIYTKIVYLLFLLNYKKKKNLDFRGFFFSRLGSLGNTSVIKINFDSGHTLQKNPLKIKDSLLINFITRTRSVDNITKYYCKRQSNSFSSCCPPPPNS